ncbi:hypothetical protein Theco_3367 [Thermobacillus composti KWC4]|uniref:Uncharacterized protein n=1 Tax=Thermobacillus composti (strain DSM 18247 / JCM 13945 / KWC4) TaxID=717605 RepID=L0EJM4_THECK|nr:hypothetical protein [Thermobacillus composti]AGA59415.1 hypothetical protein Theco_3367 [Thermobacillus composti KWC4]
MMMAKTFSAFLSAIPLSAIFTFNQRNAPDNDSFGYVFFTGSMVLAAFYLLVGIPSVMADRMAYRSRHRFVSREAVYFILGAGFGLLFLLVRDLRYDFGLSGSMLRTILLFGLAGTVFEVL